MYELLCEIDGFLWRGVDSEIDPSALTHPSAVIAEVAVAIGLESVVISEVPKAKTVDGSFAVTREDWLRS